jgi:hypothetical protein
VLIIHADAANSNDSVKIVAAGAASDGSTGVQVRSNLVNHGHATNIGGSGNPVIRVTLDLQNGNDKVSIDGLAQTNVLIGEGNGNNDIQVGDSAEIGIVAGNGRNHIDVGSGTAFGVVALAPGNVNVAANTVVFAGWQNIVNNDNGGLHLVSISPIGNNRSGNDIHVHDRAGKVAIVDIASNGANSVDTGDGDDIVWIQGNGNNHIDVKQGNNQVQVDGNGNNNIDAKGAGSITVNGQGNNEIDAGNSVNSAVILSFAKPGGHNHVKAATGASVKVNGAVITKSGKVASTNTNVNFGPAKGGAGGSGSGAA